MRAKPLTQTWSVKTTKKALRQLCKDAEGQGFKVEHRIKGSIDNIYINDKLVGETDAECRMALVVIGVKYDLGDLIRK